MESVAHATPRVGSPAGIARVHHGRNARNLGAPREHQQIPHELDVILERLGNSHRSFRNIQLGRGLLRRLLNTPLDFTDVIQILTQASAVARIELALQPRYLIGYRIENAAVLLLTRKPLGRVAAI